MQTIPIVKDELGRSWDIGSALLQQRIIFLNGEINEQQAEAIISALLYLDAQPGDEPINLYINSPGGVVSDGLAIHDVMRRCSHKVYTYCLGQAASMGAVLLAAGDRRFALENAQVMIHQPSGGAVGKCEDIQIAAASIANARTRLTRLLARYAGRTEQEINLDTGCDCFMDAEKAKEYGLVDEVLLEVDAGR